MPAANPSIAALKTPVLVLGGTSLIGRFLTPMLAGTDAYALSRKPGEGSVRWVRGDLGAEGLQPGRQGQPGLLGTPARVDQHQALAGTERVRRHVPQRVVRDRDGDRPQVPGELLDGGHGAP